MAAAVYFGVTILTNWYTAKQQTGVVVTDPKTGQKVTIAANTLDIPAYALRPKQMDDGATFAPVPKKIAPIWPQDSHIDIIVTLSPSYNPYPISKTPAEYVVLEEKDFHMNNYSDKRSIDTKFTVPSGVQHNGTLWGHFYIGLAGSNLDPKQPGYDPGRAYHFAHPLTHYLPKKKVAKTRNLLGPASEEPEAPEEPQPSGPIITPHYHPNFTLGFIPDMGVKDFGSIHPASKQFLRLEATGARDGSGQNSWYCELRLSCPLSWRSLTAQIPSFSSTPSGSLLPT